MAARLGTHFWTRTCVRGVPRCVLNENKIDHNNYGAFIFVHRMSNDKLCPSSKEWVDFFNKKNYNDKLKFFDVVEYSQPFGLVFYNQNYWLLYNKKTIHDKMKGF